MRSPHTSHWQRYTTSVSDCNDVCSFFRTMHSMLLLLGFNAHNNVTVNAMNKCKLIYQFSLSRSLSQSRRTFSYLSSTGLVRHQFVHPIQGIGNLNLETVINPDFANRVQFQRMEDFKHCFSEVKVVFILRSICSNHFLPPPPPPPPPADLFIPAPARLLREAF